MPPDPAHPQQWVGYVFAIAVVAFVLALRARRLARPRPLKVERLWMVPAMLGVLAAVVLAEFRPVGVQWLMCAAALAIGGLLGWQRGRMMRIEVDPDTHALNQRASPAAIVFLVVIIAVRAATRGMATQGAGPLHLNALVVTDLLVVMAFGLLSAQRAEMYLRAKRLLAAARG